MEVEYGYWLVFQARIVRGASSHSILSREQVPAIYCLATAHRIQNLPQLFSLAYFVCVVIVLYSTVCTHLSANPF